MTAPLPRGRRAARTSMRILLTLIAVCLLAPAAALASGSAVIRDCSDNGKLDRSYSRADYRDALAHLPSDVDEYTSCRDVIRRAASASAAPPRRKAALTPGGARSAPPPPSNGKPSSAREKSALKAAAAGAGGPIKVGGQIVTPGAARFTADDVRNSLPTPLLAVLILLGAGALTAAGVVARNRVIARRKG